MERIRTILIGLTIGHLASYVTQTTDVPVLIAIPCAVLLLIVFLYIDDFVSKKLKEFEDKIPE